MPLVTIHWAPQLVSEQYLNRVVNGLPIIVAEELTTDEPGAQLVPTDVLVKVIPLGPHDRFGKGEGLSIIISATGFPSRMANEDVRLQKIIQRINRFKMRSDIHGFVWFDWKQGAFRKF